MGHSLCAGKNSINVLRIPLMLAPTFANSSIVSSAHVSESRCPPIMGVVCACLRGRAMNEGDVFLAAHPG